MLRRPLGTALLLAAAATAAADEAARRSPVVLAVERTGPAVVNLSTEHVVVQTLRDPFTDPFFERFFGRVAPPQRKFKATSLGSGVLIDPDGYLLTNEHVVRKASKIHVTLSDGTALEADLVAADRGSDLALCKVSSPKPLPCVSLDTVSGLLIGETAIALGNPFGLENSVTVGVVSAKDRALLNEGKVAYRDLIQTDASINPGNSGGPLLNLDGELIGVNTAVYSEAEGIGFAIPVTRVRRALAQMLDPARARLGWVGFRPDMVGLKGGRGLVVAEVEPGSPAEAAGLKPGDLLLSIDGKALGFFPCLKALSALKVGDRLVLELSRDGKPVRAALTAAPTPVPTPDQACRDRLGLAVQALTPALAERLGLGVERGCVLTEVSPGGPAARAGLEPGDVLLRLGGQGAAGPEDLAALLERAEAGKLPAHVVRGNRVYEILLEPDRPRSGR